MVDCLLRRGSDRGQSNWGDIAFICGLLSGMGFKPEYNNFELNLIGNNLILENQRWHCTDSNNKPYAIDCGNNQNLFMAIAALNRDGDFGKMFRLPNGKIEDCKCESRVDMWGNFEFNEPKPEVLDAVELVMHFTGSCRFRAMVWVHYGVLERYIFSEVSSDYLNTFNAYMRDFDHSKAYDLLNEVYWKLPDRYNIVNRPEGFIEILSIVDDDDFKDGNF